MKLGSSRRWLERHLILSQWAEITFLKEASLCARDIGAFASVLRSRVNQGAVLASGSSRRDGMILAAR